MAPPPTDAELNKAPQQLPPATAMGMGGRPPATNPGTEGAAGGLSNKYSRQVKKISTTSLNMPRLKPIACEF